MVNLEGHIAIVSMQPDLEIILDRHAHSVSGLSHIAKAISVFLSV